MQLRNGFDIFLTGQKSTPSQLIDGSSFETHISKKLLLKPLLRKLVGPTSPGRRRDESRSNWVLSNAEKASTTHTNMTKLLNRSVKNRFEGSRTVSFFKNARRFKKVDLGRANPNIYIPMIIFV